MILRNLILATVLVGCGREPHIVEKYVEVPTQPQPQPQPQPPGGGNGATTFSEMKVLVNKYCIACHTNSPFVKSEAQLKASTAKDRIWSRSMPPANAGTPLPDAERRKMLNFFQ